MRILDMLAALEKMLHEAGWAARAVTLPAIREFRNAGHRLRKLGYAQSIDNRSSDSAWY